MSLSKAVSDSIPNIEDGCPEFNEWKKESIPSSRYSKRGETCCEKNMDKAIFLALIALKNDDFVLNRYESRLLEVIEKTIYKQIEKIVKEKMESFFEEQTEQITKNILDKMTSLFNSNEKITSFKNEVEKKSRKKLTILQEELRQNIESKEAQLNRISYYQIEGAKLIHYEFDRKFDEFEDKYRNISISMKKDLNNIVKKNEENEKLIKQKDEMINFLKDQIEREEGKDKIKEEKRIKKEKK